MLFWVLALEDLAVLLIHRRYLILLRRTSMSASPILTTAQAAVIACFSKKKIRELIEAGKLPAINTSTTNKRVRWSIRWVDLEQFLPPASVQKAAAKQAVAARRERIDADVPKVFG